MFSIEFTKIDISNFSIPDNEISVFTIKDEIVKVIFGDIKPAISFFVSKFGKDFEIIEKESKFISDEIIAYFNGDLTKFQLQSFWLGKNCPKKLQPREFSRRVYSICRDIPFGNTLKYSELAKEAGNRDAARAVGMAMSKNPIPLIVPCHRVLSSTGLGGYTSPNGIRTKQALLLHEMTVLQKNIM